MMLGSEEEEKLEKIVIDTKEMKDKYFNIFQRTSAHEQH